MIGPTTASTGTQPGTQDQGAAMSSVVGKDDFLKLLVGQLRNQNPMDPMGDQDFIGQMTAISTLEQVTNLAASTAELRHQTDASQALGLLGKTVTYARADGTTAEGVVERVSFDAEGPSLTVGGTPGVRAADISEVR
jgi:flagellar basal-body rod modification protein FlgD